MKARLVILCLIFAALLPGAHALKIISGNEAVINSALNDDVFAAGNIVTISAPVSSATAAGNTIRITAAVYGDIFAAGNTISVDSDASGKIVAAGNTIDIKGDARNLLAAGNTVTIGSGTTIEKDAVISAKNVVNAGKIKGNLTVRAESFENTGTAGHVDFVKTQKYESTGQVLGSFSVVMAAGALILGIILITLMPAQFLRVDKEIRSSAIEKTVAGFVLIMVSMLVILLSALTIIGIPIAIFAALAFATAMVLSVMAVAYSLGKVLAGREPKTGKVLAFIFGFVIICILFRIPYIGGVAWLITLSLGYGALYYALREYMWREPAKGLKDTTEPEKAKKK